MKASPKKITAETVRGDFNDPKAVLHYSRAADQLGLWASEAKLIERYLPDRTTTILEAGCGAGRGALALSALGYRSIVAFDFAEGLLGQARKIAEDRKAEGITFQLADATALGPGAFGGRKFQAILFLFNGLMQIPGRANRRRALGNLREHATPGAHILFTTHDRASSATEKLMWRLEEGRWQEGKQDPRLVEFGDRYFEDEAGRVFMHLPDRAEVETDLTVTGWELVYDALRREVAREGTAVTDFSDECRFWVACNPKPPEAGGRR